MRIVYHTPVTGRLNLRQSTILLAMALLTFGAFREWNVRPNEKVTIRMLDVGQGDSIFITGPSGQQILIDGGPDLSALAGIGRHMSLFDRSIDLLVLSHPDLDHVFALPTILRRYNVGAVLLTGVAGNSSQYDQTLKELDDQNIPIIIADPGKDIDLGDGLFIDVLWPPPMYFGQKVPDANNTSIVMRLQYGEDSMLFTGDMEEKEEGEVLASGADIHADILKVGHHGSRTSTSTGFLLAINPDLALISVGRDNAFEHPHKEVIDRLMHVGIPFQSTAQEGEITIEWDGKDSLER